MVIAELRGGQLSQLQGRLVRGASWSLLGAVVARGAVLVASVIIARVVGRETFGVFGIVQSTVAAVHVVVGSGLGLTATRHVAAARGKDPVLAGRFAALALLAAVALGILLSIILFGISSLVARRVLASAAITIPLRLGIPGVLFGILVGTQTGILGGLEAFRSVARANLWGGLCGVAGVLIGVWGWGLNGAIAGSTFSLAVQCAFSQRELHAELRRHGIVLNARGGIGEWRVLYGYGLPSIIASALASPVTWAVSALLARQPRGYYELGAFNAANQWFNVLALLPSIVSQAMLPMLSQLMAARDSSGVRAVLRSSLAFNAIFIGGSMPVLALASPWLMRAYGPAFQDQWPVMLLAILTAGLIAMQTPLAQMLAAADMMWLSLLLNGVWATLYVVGARVLIAGGAFGLAEARAVAYLGYSALLVLAAWRIYIAMPRSRALPGE